MIISYLISGLGNQMFQYACARALSLRLGTDLLIKLDFYKKNPDRPYQLDHFNISITTNKDTYIDATLFSETNSRNFYPEVLTLNDNVILIGYWQFEDYFIDYAKQIRRELILKDPISESSQIWANQIQNDPIPVSLHVRRGDYIKGNWYVVSQKFYERCVGILRENFPEMSLYIFSDDLNWCRKHFNFEVPTNFVDCNDESHGYEDMFLMSLCRHHIIANSTFSWWGAWLDDRIGSLVFSPRKMFYDYQPVKDFRRFPTRWIIFDDV